MRTYEVFYNNGNRKIFEAESMTELLQFLLAEGGSQYIYKIELREQARFLDAAQTLHLRGNFPLYHTFGYLSRDFLLKNYKIFIPNLKDLLNFY